MKAESRSAWMIFRWPLLIGGTSVAGLLTGLVGENMADVLACLLVGIPLILISCERKISLRRL
jgi:hypothetical protein